jgi:OOP family OmpA-OmpF porin
MNTLKPILALGLAGSIAATPAQGDGFSDDRWYVAPFGTYLHTGGDRAGKDGWGTGAALGKIINEHFNIELRGFWQDYGHDNGFVGGHTDLTGGTIDVQYYFFRDALSPYLVAAIGGMNTSSRFPGYGGGYSEPSFIFETGLGATYTLAGNFLLRADLRYRLDTLPVTAGSTTHAAFYPVYPNDELLHDLVLNIGFVVPFGDQP